jgi:apolipoprotein N-acyltransferase
MTAQIILTAAATATTLMLWLTGPTVNAWPLAWLSLVPLMVWVQATAHLRKPPGRWKGTIYLAFFAYFLISLQGLRYAHPLMFLPLIAMAAYLAVYPLLFFVLLRRALGLSSAATFGSAVFWAAAFWVGGEWVRNYFATGISVLMLGHSLVDMPGGQLLQIADLGGTYAVSLLLVCVNYAIADIITGIWCASSISCASSIGCASPGGSEPASPVDLASPAQLASLVSGWKVSVPVAVTLLIGSFLYGSYRLGQPLVLSDTTIMLVGRDEQTEYQQDLQRELSIFRAYAQQSMQAVRNSGVKINAVVWPESMLSGGQPWLTAQSDLKVPNQAGGQRLDFDASEFRRIIEQTQNDFQLRSIALQTAMRSDGTSPSLIGGCGLVRYGDVPRQYSGVIHVDPNGQVAGTYAKNHLVMFGEYIPLIQSIPFLRDFVPPGLGLDAGAGAEVFRVGSLRLLPNLCIETAVERISVDYLREVDADVIVTMTNDAWFDHSAVVSHHLRCAQIVAIGCRRPVLSAANGGPTAWIDSNGRMVEKLPYDQAGEIIATPKLDNRDSLYVRFGAWPFSILAVVFLIACFDQFVRWWKGDAGGSVSASSEISNQNQ